MRAVSDSFKQRVYGVVRAIPAGKVMGYGHVAAALTQPGMARQVGWALAALPSDTDVPWQRVVRSSGHIASQGAPDRAILQRGLLVAEGVGFIGERVNIAVFGVGPGFFLDAGDHSGEAPAAGGPARALGTQHRHKSPEGLDLDPGWPQPAPLQGEGDGLGVFDEPSHSAGRNGAKEPSIRARGSPSARIDGAPAALRTRAGSKPPP